MSTSIFSYLKFIIILLLSNRGMNRTLTHSGALSQKLWASRCCFL